jgi:hypothetical protein
MLRELSKSFPDLWIRVSDSDGEFLLVEAAKVTPKWLSPENDTNRVWIHDGKLRIIPLSSSGTAENTALYSKPLSLVEAIDTIKTSPSRLIHSPLIEAEAFYRLEKYPSQISASFHHSLVAIPRKLAYILHARPKSVAPATEAFYLRDPRSLKPILSASSPTALIFPPTDLVTVSVRFTKVLYAQLKSQRFPPPPVWRTILRDAEMEIADGAAAPKLEQESGSGSTESGRKLARLEMGMKLTTGFEMLARTAHESSSRLVREVGLLLEDLAEDGGESALPTDDQIRGWEGVGREDDDSWMDIDYRDFERALDGSQDDGKGTGGGFGDAGAQADLQKIVSRFEAFLNDETAGLEGAEIDEMDEDNDSDDEEESDEDEDKEVSFDEEQFSRMMREMMGLPADDITTKEKGKQKVVAEETEEQAEDEDAEIRNLMEQMESELRGHGALDLGAKPEEAVAIKEEGEGESKPGKKLGSGEESDDGAGDEAVDIDYNLAKNLLESFKGQAGMAGPAGNLLGLMGVTLPRDEEEMDNEQNT